jgi:hypothetical protein
LKTGQVDWRAHVVSQPVIHGDSPLERFRQVSAGRTKFWEAGISVELFQV